MGKRARRTSIYPKKQQKLHKGDRHLEDRICQLPDDILVSILSCLTVREAARTSVLSHRWENLWKFSTGSLNFDGSNKQCEMQDDPKLLKTERSKYISQVNEVCKSHQGPTIDELQIRFQLNKHNRCHLDEWVKFAIAKRVQKLELDLTPLVWGLDRLSECYVFPQESYIHIRSPFGLSCIQSLKSLCLRYVNVTGEIAEYILSSCPLLEQLCVQRSDLLVDLKVSGSSLRLKHLEIIRCVCLNYVEICAPNLLTLILWNQKIRLNIEYAPQLVDVSIGQGFRHTVSNFVRMLSNCLLQLKALTFVMILFREDLESRHFPVLYNLRQLTWIVHASYRNSLLGLTSMIEACPFLEKFTLQVHWYGRRRRKKEKAARHPHKCLQVVEIEGFAGSMLDVELALYLLESAVNLEKMIINPRYKSSEFLMEDEETKEEAAARKYALKLKRKLPPGAELIVL